MADPKPFAKYNSVDMIPDTMTFGLSYNTQISTSPLNGSIKTVQLPGARWSARLSYTNLSEDETNTLLAWLSSLNGMAGRFTMYDFSHPATKNGVTAGTVNNVASAGGLNVVTFSSLTGGELEVGDLFTLQPLSPYVGEKELKIVVGKTDGLNYTVEPEFRRPISYYAVTAIGVGSTALCRMMLTSDDQAEKAVQSKIYLGAVTIECTEQFYNE